VEKEIQKIQKLSKKRVKFVKSMGYDVKMTDGQMAKSQGTERTGGRKMPLGEGKRVRGRGCCGSQTRGPARLFLVESVELRGFLMKFLWKFHELVAGG
jgi:hypothetical protein